MKIYLSKKIMESLSHNAISVYVALRSIIDQEHDNYFITINMLCYILFGSTNHPDRYIDNIKSGLHDLESKQLISISMENVSRNERIINLSKLKFDTSKEFFVIVDESEVNKVMSHDSDKNKLLTYFIEMIGTLTKNKKGENNFDDGIGYCSIDYLASISKISEHCASDYNKILEDLELIHIYRSDCILLIENQFSGVTNTYSRFIDKDKCIKVGKKHSDDVDEKNKRNKKTDGNKTKSYSMKFNRILKGFEYSADETKEIYLQMRQLNIRNKEAWKGDEYIKDLSIFKDYDFYIIDEPKVEVESTVNVSKDIVAETWGGKPKPNFDTEDDSMNTNEIMPEPIIEDDSDDQMDIKDILELQTEDEYNEELSKSNQEMFERFIESKDENDLIFGEYDNLFASMGFDLFQIDEIKEKNLSDMDYSKIKFESGIKRMKKELSYIATRNALGI